ncbi:4-hydroxy-tetrahydrodipicolinate reductase [Lutimonas zeaxanthinifaciens]|uniref:4-hydroxy-tetrahydrodipicolinate reductase n=1 Tax=Lutimonas zeaxanthinifaciens TaxID=3060215 RepID=UPI00265C9BD3|nr:4-hydroxy-tetrahydrodipicolinate reductase [Lutimonas sp. YSD2104]WKK67306.1 4-hydroxy-tetrahydrodipicolinate reductase [Lutimonas sp. YSD2104]
MKIALLGYGRMGQAIEKIALERGHDIVIRKDIEPLEVDLSLADVAIDFSHPDAAFDNIKSCIDEGVPVVSGTTGWLDKYDEIKDYCIKKEGGFIYASNYSIGVNLFFNLNAYLAKMMRPISEYNVEMEEIHHVHKLDAPSGTAISLANDILSESDKQKWSIETKEKEDLFISVKREGEVPGTHAVTYSSGIDSIEIKHTAFNRTGFALGAVVAAEWLEEKKGIYSMKDVLGL